MISLTQAYSILLEQSIPLPIQEVPLFEANGKILAKNLSTLRNLPAFSNSAMDGYAISEICPSYSLQDTILAGELKPQTILPSSCIKVMTGAMIPPNTLAVIPFEHTIIQDSQIIPTQPIKTHQNIKFCGEDCKVGNPLLSQGTRLNYASLSLLASQGMSQVPIYQTPKIAIFSSGDEIKEPWEEAQGFQVYNTNAIAYHSILQDFGFPSTYQGILPDCKSSLRQAIKSFQDFDIIITSGGASVGEADFFEEILQEQNAKILFHGINLKPGRPMLFAKFKNTLIFSLPGNPLSGALNLITLVLPTLQKINNANAYKPLKITATLKEDLKLKDKRNNMVLGTFDGTYFTPYQKGKYGSGSLLPLYASNAIATFDETTASISKDSQIKIMLISYLFSQ